MGDMKSLFRIFCQFFQWYKIVINFTNELSKQKKQDFDSKQIVGLRLISLQGRHTHNNSSDDGSRVQRRPKIQRSQISKAIAESHLINHRKPNNTNRYLCQHVSFIYTKANLVNVERDSVILNLLRCHSSHGCLELSLSFCRGQFLSTPPENVKHWVGTLKERCC